MSEPEYILPPNEVNGSITRGYLEIEVSRISLSLQKGSKDTPSTNNNNHITLQNHRNNGSSGGSFSQALAAKFIWSGESAESAASIRIGRCSKGSPLHQQRYKNHNNNNKPRTRNNNHYHQQPQQQQQLHQQQQLPLRYSIRSSLALFLDYLRSCEPIEIVIDDGACKKPLGEAHIRLPGVLLRKYAANYGSCCSFEHKTKIYALYKRQPPHQQQQQQPQKTGEIQLRFKFCFRMLFAPHGSGVQLTSLQQRSKHDVNESVKRDESKSKVTLASAAPATTNGERHEEPKVVAEAKSTRVAKSEAMKKLDAKLVAYLAGEDLPTKQEEERLALGQLQNDSPPNGRCLVVDEMIVERFREQQLAIFKRITGVRLHMEALTLQPEGTKRMELLQSEIRPIFTVECQLSHELVKHVPRYDMFHIMQFESEKFQSLTQCTRFGQEAQRDIKLALEEQQDIEKTAPQAIDFGRIHFTVWWREPGTCLNEMLGMGVLELEELYNASLLEQCKCININRRGLHLASLYFKLSLLTQPLSTAQQCDENNVKLLQQLMDKASIKQCNGNGSDSDNAAAKQQTESIDGHVTAAAAATAVAQATSASTQNNNVQLESSHFSAETSKVRLLKGFIYANETRNFEMVTPTSDYFLVCRRFWLDEATATAAGEGNKFNYQEQFAVLNDEKFLNRVDKQHLQLEVWRRMSVNDGNGNAAKDNVQAVGIVRLPLHQFFIAYRDAKITNHLCKGKLPVISIDAWVPIIDSKTGDSAHAAELKCLLAIGSEEQILNLKQSRGFATVTPSVRTISAIANVVNFPQQPLDMAAEHMQSTNITAALNADGGAGAGTTAQMRKTSDIGSILDMLQKALVAQPPAAPPPLLTTVPSSSPPHTSAAAAAATPLKPLSPAANNVKSFKFSLDIQRATGLPLNAAAKGKKGGSKRNANAAASKRFPPNEAPSTYVTFQADEGYGNVYKSHEGVVYATNIVEKSTQPVWQQRFRVATSVDYLMNSQKRFILKVWKKAANDLAQCRLQPTPMDDAIIGFAALDLTVFLRGLQIGGWFNIVDFNGRINGQLEMRCQPLEDVQKLMQQPTSLHAAAAVGALNVTATAPSTTEPASMDAVIDQFENSLDLTHLNLGQAIKRKFTELEEISQRLRSRLVDVTGEQFVPSFDPSSLANWQALDVAAFADDEGCLDEFERDINTPPRTASPPSPAQQHDKRGKTPPPGAADSPKE